MVGEIAWAAPQVIAVRTARLVAGGWPPDARNRRELRRMVGEKASAFTRATAAAALATPVGLAGVGVAALKPVHRTVRANLRRLGR
jgi:hypothetical protein